MKCIVCNTEFESKRQDAKYCSSTCRSKASRATDNNATDKFATDNGMDSPGQPEDKFITDCNGNKHKIDYDVRKTLLSLLLDWADGKGNEYQYRLGRTSMQYTVSQGISLVKYLGYDCKDIISRFNRIHRQIWPEFKGLT